MLRLPALVAISALFWGFSGPLYAQAPTPTPTSERYSFQVTSQGVLRFDSRTGEISQCANGPGGPICRAAPDERAALEGEIARLEAENAALKKAVAGRSGDGPPPIPPAAIPEAAGKSPPPDAAPSADAESQPAKGRIRTALDAAWRNLVSLASRMKGALQ